MDTVYTESNLRKKLDDKSNEILEGVLGRLRDDNLFKFHRFELSGVVQLDGSITISDFEPLKSFVAQTIYTLFLEYKSQLEATLFTGNDT
jgi:hypothetical protein